MSDSDGPAQEPAGLDGLPPMHSISKGEVVSVQAYGAFVRLPGYKKEGLVHVSEMSASRVESASEIVDVGEQVWIKVIGREIRDDKVKLSFSMKAVNQGTGRDLDPNNVMAEQDARRRKKFRDHTGNRITLEAVLNTTCSKCGCKGHFTKDCFSAPGLQYALLPEEEDEEPRQPQQPQQQTSTVAPQQDSDKKKKKKKEKKMKKKRKRERKESDSDSSSSSSSDECKSKRRRRDHTHDREDKKKKKHKKHRSHKHS
ncbi:nucleolar protein of 40 kDa [Centropristis striata]|uniref:nucleolar protein of 40 kDa n=1 Tax=Centropristis striata TaxID=184440 RepID=UPI0027E1F500|nr:nucleolar protein of 40 kDa [Centropristis striata]XP_059206343.1 nucleolar protein of 40 kDa [Centropristis striata]XP_059206344.1 nucleolar protein of 40 kDa [Centropristis striata]